MKNLIITSTALIVLLAGCPAPEPTPDPTPPVVVDPVPPVIEVPPVVEVEPTPELPQCVRLYLHKRGRQFWRAIKTPMPEGEENPQNPSQKYNYEVCGDRPVGMRPPSPNHSGTRKCDITGGLVMAYKNGGFFNHAVEIDEHCIDAPINGACKETNCGWFFKRTPYPPTCTVPETQVLGTCIAMWNI